MKKFEGTKGVWSESECNDEFPTSRDVRSTEGMNICTVWGIGSQYHPSKSEAVANAKLITAAPELLESSIFTYNFLRKTGIRFLFPKFFKKLKEALEKALEKALN